MKYNHHNLTFDLPETWLLECNMAKFKPSSSHYLPKQLNDGREIQIVNIIDIAPCEKRAAIKGVFCDKSSTHTAKDRVVSILRGVYEKQSIAPIEVRQYQGVGDYKYQMHHGSHRLHCSIALGFTQIPAVYSRAHYPNYKQGEISRCLSQKGIDCVHEGQKAAVKVDTFNFTKYGLVQAEILTISGDAIRDENLGLVYSARIKLH